MVAAAESVGRIIQRARALAEVGRIGAAVDVLSKGLSQNPESARLHQELASLLRRAGHTADALEHAQAAVGLEPESADAHMELALAQSDRGRRYHSEMMTSARRATELDSLNPLLWYLFTECAIAAGDLQEAERGATICVRFADQRTGHTVRGRLASAKAIRLRGKARTRMLAEAETHFEALLAVDPTDGWTHEQLAEINDHLGRHERRIVHLRAAERAGRHHLRSTLLELVRPYTPVAIVAATAFFALIGTVVGLGIATELGSHPLIATAVGLVLPVVVWCLADRGLADRQANAPTLLKKSDRQLYVYPAITLVALAGILTLLLAVMGPGVDRPESAPESTSGATPFVRPTIPARPPITMITADGQVVVLSPGRPAITFPLPPENLFRPEPTRQKVDPLQRWQEDRFIRAYTPALVILSLLGALIYSRRWLKARRDRARTTTSRS